jgi:putative hydrolase
MDYPVILGSDAHFYTYVGGFAQAEKLLEIADMPEELVINTSVKDFKEFIK